MVEAKSFWSGSGWPENIYIIAIFAVHPIIFHSKWFSTTYVSVILNNRFVDILAKYKIKLCFRDAGENEENFFIAIFLPSWLLPAGTKRFSNYSNTEFKIDNTDNITAANSAIIGRVIKNISITLL